jgi:hypothetical protein
VVLPDSRKVPRAPRYLGTFPRLHCAPYGTLTPSGGPFQAASSEHCRSIIEAPQPRMSAPIRFRLFPVRSPLLGESLMLSFPPGTKMFQFPGCPPHCLCVQQRVTGHYSGRVPPFGYPEIFASLQLPQAFRRLTRPSSALCPKASTRRPL